MAMADWLSIRRAVGEVWVGPSSDSSRLSHTASFATCTPAMYSASVLESVTEVCFFELQLTAAPVRVKTKPDVDLRSFTSLAQSASTFPVRVKPWELPRWNTR